MSLQIKVTGLEHLRNKLNSNLLARPLKAFFKAAVKVAGEEELKASTRDTGRMVERGVIEKFDPAAMQTWASVHPRSRLAHLLEWGARPHFPPSTGYRLVEWSERQGIDPFLVARALGQHGFKARPFMKKALQASLDDIRSLVDKLGAAIRAEWDGQGPP